MKKVLAICLVIMMVLGMSTSVFAAKGGFVSSPSNNGVPRIVRFAALDEDCSAKLVIVPYGEKDKLPKEYRDLMDKAYEDCKKSECPISDLFFVTYEGCDDHAGHKGFKIVLDADTLDGFTKLSWMDKNGEWHTVEDAHINSDGHLEFTLEHLDVPLAIVVNCDKSPQTGDNNNIYIYGILMVVSAAAVVTLVIKSKKYA